jgi:hypothetical protein
MPLFEIEYSAPSYEEERHWACGRKVRYGHLQTATKSLVELMRKGRDNLEVYHCEYCGGWHVGHKPTVLVRFLITGLRRLIG